MKSISTLVGDIYTLLQNGTDQDLTDSVKVFSDNLSSLLLSSLKPKSEKHTIRMSNLGKPDRQLWYEVREDIPKEEITGSTYLKFMYGNLIEELVLFLAEVAGHKVEHRQKEIVLDGIVGHIDAVIDDVLIDVKSASPISYKKFKDGSIKNEDTFGYMNQLSGYMDGMGVSEGAFVAVDKQNGNICVMNVEAFDRKDTFGRIAHVKEMVKNTDPPERCYEPEVMGKSGNMKLPTGCSYCPFKKTCWSDVKLRKFLYSTGPVWLTHVEKEPEVLEVDV